MWCDIKSIEDILIEKGPILSGKLSEYLTKYNDLQPPAARQRVSRSSSVKKLKLGFINKQSFVFFDSQYDTDNFWRKIVIELKANSQAYYSFIHALKFHYGYIKKSELAAYTFSPIKKLKGHRLASDIIRSLIKNHIIHEFQSDIYIINEKIFPKANFHRFQAIQMAKSQVIKDFVNWSKNTNLIGYNSSRTLSAEPEFAKFQWSYTAPSYIFGLIKLKKDNLTPGFIIADLLIGKKIVIDDIKFFLNKVDIIKTNQNLPKVIPFLICESIERQAFSEIKRRGIVVGFIKELFGSVYSNTLALLIETISNATKIIKEDPDKFLDLVKKMNLLEGQLGNMKGDLFEFVVGFYYSIMNKPFKIGLVITEREYHESREIDVLVEDTKEIIVNECKGLNSPLEFKYVKEWLTETVPIIRKWILAQDVYKNKEIIFELWSVSGFDDGSISLLKEHSTKTHKYKLRYYNGKDIKDKISQTRNDKIKEVLEQYYV